MPMTGSSAPTLLGPLFASDAMAAVFSDAARLQGMLDFEAALARAEASIGLFPAATATSIAQACKAELFDITALARDTAQAGNLAIPMASAARERPIAAPPVIPSTDTARLRRSASRRVIITILPSTSF